MSLSFSGIFRNVQGHFIDMSPSNKPGRYNIRIDGFSYGKWTSSKQMLYWRCSRAQAIGFETLYFYSTVDHHKIRNNFNYSF